MYQGISQLLVDNPINRYLIKAPSLPEPPAAVKCSSIRLRPDDHTPSRQAAKVSIRDLQLRSVAGAQLSGPAVFQAFSSSSHQPFTWLVRTGLSLDLQLNRAISRGCAGAARED
jgi:hypothetical protein